MAWLRDGAGLPRFQQPPRSLPDEAAPASNGGRAGSGSLDGNGLAHAYSTDTQRSTEEEEELSREVRRGAGPASRACARGRPPQARRRGVPPSGLSGARRARAHNANSMRFNAQPKPPSSTTPPLQLTMELMADLGIGDRGSLGSAGGGARSHACSHRGSARPSRKASEALPGSDAEAGGAAAGSADPGAHWDWVSEEEKEEELQPSLYDQLGGGVVVKVRPAARLAGPARCAPRGTGRAASAQRSALRSARRRALPGPLPT